MAKQTIFLGTVANDQTGTTLRAGGDMMNDNFDEIYSAIKTGDYIIVESLADLPTPVSDVITLVANKTYFFVNDIDLLGDRLVGASNTTILGASSEVSIITSTGLGASTALFTTAYTTPIRHIAFKDVGTALDIDGTGNSAAFDWTSVNFVNVPTIGVVEDFTNLILNKCAFLNSKGLTLDGTFDTFAAETCLFSGDGAAGSIISVPATATINRRFRITYSSIVATSSTVGITFNASASVPVESYILDVVNFSGGGTYTSGVSVTDNKASFNRCKGISNSDEVSMYYMNSNATTTTVSATNTHYKVLGTTTSAGLTQKFTNTNNRATYAGSFTRLFTVTATISVESGNNNQVGVYIAKNGSVISESEVYGTTSGSGRAENIVVQTLVELATTDYIEIFVENATAVNNILATDLNVIVI